MKKNTFYYLIIGAILVIVASYVLYNRSIQDDPEYMQYLHPEREDLSKLLGSLIFLGLLLLMVLLVRLFGAWMLRIDEVIALLKEIKDKLEKPKE